MLLIIRNNSLQLYPLRQPLCVYVCMCVCVYVCMCIVYYTLQVFLTGQEEIETAYEMLKVFTMLYVHVSTVT